MKISTSDKNVLVLSLDFKQLILTLIFLFYTFILLRTAWITDDAAITLRTVLNFVHGNGPVFNLGERVQAYTHPLWFLVLSAAYVIFRNIFVSTFFISICTALLSIFLLIKYIALDYKNAAAITWMVLFSQAFIDYSTSGLENPLSFLLFAIFTIALLKSYLKQFSTHLSSLWFIFALIYLNRPDAILIPLPVLLYATYKNYLITNSFFYISKNILINLTPIFLWTGFAIIYYGFPLPNTTYAKLGTGIPQFELLLQGVYYFIDSLKYDPFTLSVITIAIVISLLSKQVVSKLLIVGILLYFVYILKIGGDFMSGRFFAYPFFVAIVILALTKFNSFKLFVIFYLLLTFWGNYSISINNNGILRDIDVATLVKQDLIKPSGIADERKFYYFVNRGLLHSTRSTFEYAFNYESETNNYESETYDRILSICGGLGYSSLYSGNTIYWIDTCALADPLLSKIPMTYNSNWRIGHFERAIPVGYQDSLLQDKNLIQDKCLSSLYDKIKIITRGELFSLDRMYAILDMNLYTNSCIIVELPNNLTVKIENLAIPRLKGNPWNQDTIIIQPNQTLKVILPVLTLVNSIDISFDHNDVYEVLLYAKDTQQDKLILRGNEQPGLERQIVKLKRELYIDNIIIQPKEGDQWYSIGHVIVGTKTNIF